MARVHLSSALRHHTDGIAEVEVEAPTVMALIAELERRYPGIGESLATGVAVAIDGEVINDPGYEPIPPGAEVHVIPQISGG